MAPGKRGSAKQLLTRSFSAAPAAIPPDHKRAQELYAQFKKGKKRAKAQEEAEAMYLAGANSALCIALAKMHMTLAVEQALKLDEESAREAVVLGSLHAALQYAVTGAVQFHSIQCVVLCVFTLHCCRGRGSAEQKAQRQGWHAQLSDALPAGDKAKWGAVGWVDPRLESHATQDRFGFEWNQRGQHPTVEAWAEAVRDDWTKFMHKARVADTIDFKLLERLPTKNPESLRELLHEVEQSVDRRLAGNVTPLNNADKEALKQRLDILDALDARRAAAAAGGNTSSSLGLGLSGAGVSSVSGSKPTAVAAAAAPPAPSHHQSLTNQWLPALHTAQLNKQKQKAEHKRLVEAQGRAQQRATLIRDYLALKFDPNAAPAAAGGSTPGDAQLAASASMPLRDLQAAVAQLAANRDLSAAEAELAGANLALVVPPGGADAAAESGPVALAGGRRHVWYGDPLLGTSESRHRVEGYSEMEELLTEHQRQDWSMFEYAGQLVCRDVEGWQAVVNALPVKPVLLREPCPDLLLDRFTPDPAAITDTRIYSTDLSLIDGGAAAAAAGDELEVGGSDDDAFSDALSRQASLGTSECGDTPMATAAAAAEQQAAAAAAEQQQAATAAAAAPARRSGKPLLQRVMEALKQQGHLEPPVAAPLQQPAADQQPADQQPADQQQQVEAPAGAGQPPVTDAPAAAAEQQQEEGQPQSHPRRAALPRDAEDLQSLFIEHHAHEWIPRVASTWGYTQDQARQFFQQWVEEGVEAGHMDFLDRLADAAKHAWLKDVLDTQLASADLAPETAAALEQMRNELWLADVRQKERELLPFNFLHKKRVRGHDGVVLDADSEEDEDPLALAAAAAVAATAAAGSGVPPRSPRSDAGSSSGISWRSGSTGSSLPHHLGSMAAADILDSYMRELLHNTLPCLDAILGQYSDAQTECAARLLPEDRLGEVRVEQMVRRGFAGHCMVQLIYSLHLGKAPVGAVCVTMRHLADILADCQHPSQIVWDFVTSERAAGEVEEAYRNLLELEARSQGRVMSRPVSACTRVLAPLLLQDWEHLKASLTPDEFLHTCKCRLGRMTLAALRHLHTRGRLMEGVLWQLNSYILNCLEKAGEAAVDRTQQEELGKLWEELADVTHDNQDCFNYVARLPLRMMLPLYTFVGLLCAEAFHSAADISPELEDVSVVEGSVARLSDDGTTLVLSPEAVDTFVEAAAEVQAAAGDVPLAPRRPPALRPLPGSAEASTGAPCAAVSGDRCTLLADYAAGVTEVQRSLQRLAAGGGMGMPYQLGAGLLGSLGSSAAAAVAAAGSATGASAAELAERSRLCQHLHRLLYAEAVLGTLFQRCEDISDGLEATSQVLRFMAKGLDEFIAGTLSEPLPPAPPLHVEQQLRDAQYVLAAADCAQLALMLANERLRAVCYADTLAALREEQAAGGEGLQEGQQNVGAVMDAAAAATAALGDDAAEPGCIAAAVERFSRLHADMQEESRHDWAALQQLASSLASPTSIPLLKSVDLENVAIVDSVLQFAQNIGNVSQPSLQPAIEQYRSILADKQAEAHERLEQVKAYVVAASRQLEHQRSQLGVLLEWCRIRQLGLIGQLRSNYCAHSALDQLADLAVRAAAVLRWEPELRKMQEEERQANMLALQQELDAEQALAEERAARAEKRKAQKSKKAAGAANGVAHADADSSSGSDAEQAPPPAQHPSHQAQQQQQAQQAQQAQRRQAVRSQGAQPAVLAAAASPAKGRSKAGGGRGEGKQAGGPQSAQAAAYQRMLEEYGLDVEAAKFAQQLAAKQAPRQQQQQQQDVAQPPASAGKQHAAGAVGSGSPGKAAKAAARSGLAVVVAKRPASAPGGSSGASGGPSGSSEGGAGGGGGGGGGTSATVLVKPPGAKELMRVVGYYGDWLCFCGDMNKLWDTCVTCGQSPPCRDWVRGICKYSDTCRFCHPPFDLPDGTTIPMSERIAKPAPDAALYRKGQVVLPAAARQQQAAAAAKAAAAQRRTTAATIVPALPSVNAWQKPLHAAPAAPPPPPVFKQQQDALAAPMAASAGGLAAAAAAALQPAVAPPPPAETPEPLQSMAAACSDTRDAPPFLSSASAADSSSGLGWNPIGSGFELGTSSGLATPTLALASADSSRAATPSLAGAAGATAGADLAAAGSMGASASDMLAAMFPFSGSSSGLQGLGLGNGSSLAASVAGAQPWEHSNGGSGGGSGMGPTGDESAFLSQLMQGLDVGDEQGDADLASLLGPIAADVGGMEPHQRSTSASSGSTHLGLASGSQRSLSLSGSGMLASPQRPAMGPSLLDGLAAAQQQQQQQQQTASAPTALFAAGLRGGNSMASMQQQQAGAAPARDGGLLVALLACLWHCAAFRQLVLTWPEIVHKADPVVHALHRAFAAYGASAASVPPDTLQAAAAAAGAAAELADTLAGQLFGGGALGDAGEVLGGMYQRIREVESMRGIPSGVDQCFGLQLAEGVQCDACGKVTRQAQYTQYFVNVPATALRAAAQRLGVRHAGTEAPPLGQLLQLVESQTARTCDIDAGGCGAQTKLLQLLERPPRVVVLQLSWETQAQLGAEVRATLAAAGERLDLSQLYLGVHPASSAYCLSAMLCYRTHPGSGASWCQAFLLDGTAGRWLATLPGGSAGFELVGTWSALLQRFAAERMQPSLLFYMAVA